MATPTAPPAPRRELVLGAAAAMVAVQLAFRAWALLPSYFYLDDYRLLGDARDSALDVDYLVRPYDSQFMPVGRLVAWLVSRGETLSWTPVALSTLVLQAVASAACVAMLVTLFGWRPRVLAVLGLYLSTPLVVPASMWWAAALNQLPLHASFFGAVALWVHYLRTGRTRWLLLTMAVVAIGLLAYVKTVFVLLVLAWLALGWFATGSPGHRLVTVVRWYWPAVVAGVALGASFTTYYVVAVPRMETAGTAGAPVGALADRMLATTLPTTLLGGPWRWDTINPPVGLADPPSWLVHLSWTTIALVVVYLALVRTRTLRAWVLLGGYAGVAYVVLLLTRGPVVGAVAGAELRYLTDVTCAAVLALGLATMRLRGAVEPSEPRAQPLLLVRPPRFLVFAALAAVVASGVWSSWSYARIWHEQNPGEQYFTRAIEGTTGEVVAFADQTVPQRIMPGYLYPDNTTASLLPMLTANARFPSSTDRLHVLDASGAVRLAEVDGIAAPDGPVDGCGWLVREAGRTIPLPDETVGLSWWLEVGYLASADSALTVQAGATVTTVDLYAGLGTLFVEVVGEVDEVRLSGLDPGVTLCVDAVEVGTPVPAEEDR